MAVLSRGTICFSSFNTMTFTNFVKYFGRERVKTNARGEDVEVSI